jgi:hypothetical protein
MHIVPYDNLSKINKKGRAIEVKVQEVTVEVVLKSLNHLLGSQKQTRNEQK